MPVSGYLQRARECADLAERLTGADKMKLLEHADAWLALAKQAANEANLPASKPPKR